MNARRKTLAAVFLFTAAVCAVFGFWNHGHMNKKKDLSQAEAEAGSRWENWEGEDLQENYFVDESFSSALPLVILDTRPEEAEAEASGSENAAGIYTEIKLSFIDHENKINGLGDRPTGMVLGKLQEAECESIPSDSPKKQYLLRLQIEDGQPFPMKILGMDQSGVWLLNGFQTDESYVRDCIFLNAANALSLDAQDMRFCEVIICSDRGFEYMGLYGMYNIKEADQRERDRMQKGVKGIEERLYSDQDSAFLEYRDLLDVGSFVDYFIINEYFSGYGLPWDSTCLYEDQKGKIHIRVTGGVDSPVDHQSGKMMEPEEMSLPSAPWFDRLITDEYFVEKTVKRYRELRKTILDQDILDKKLEEAAAGIEEAVLRDKKRWPGLYQKGALVAEQEGDSGFGEDRNRRGWEEEVQRAGDTLRLHGNYLDEQITSLYELVQARSCQRPKLFLAICFVSSFFVSVIVVQRMRNRSS